MKKQLLMEKLVAIDVDEEEIVECSEAADRKHDERNSGSKSRGRK